MKERQRWQPEEDALLRAYVHQYGPKEWSLLPQRMGRPNFHRDPKSCLERWKNYLKPGLKKGSLSPEEQSLVVSLQAKHGNKWKLIASHLPGRTPKRLGKWWEVFKEKQLKQQQKQQHNHHHHHHQVRSTPPPLLQPQQGQYDHILETFAEKYVIPPPPLPPSMPATTTMVPADLSLSGGRGGGDAHMPPVLSLATTVGSSPSSSCNMNSIHAGPHYSHHVHHHRRLPPFSQALPPWMSSTSPPTPPPSSTPSTTTTVTGTNSPSVSLSLSPSEPRSPDMVAGRYMGLHQAATATLVQLCRELEEGRQSWAQHKKEAHWRLSRLEQQLESEKARKKREKEEEVEAKIRSLREEEASCLDRIDAECREQLSAIQRDAEAKEAKVVEMWTAKHAKLARLLEKMGSSASGGAAASVHGIHHHHYNKDLH